jgi:hypothetical protein
VLQPVLIQTAQAFFIFNQKGEVSIPVVTLGHQNGTPVDAFHSKSYSFLGFTDQT